MSASLLCRYLRVPEPQTGCFLPESAAPTFHESAGAVTPESLLLSCTLSRLLHLTGHCYAFSCCDSLSGSPFRPLLPSGLSLNRLCSGSPQQPAGCLSSSFHPSLTLLSVVFFKASVRLLKFWCFPFQQNPDSLLCIQSALDPNLSLGSISRLFPPPSFALRGGPLGALYSPSRVCTFSHCSLLPHLGHQGPPCFLLY